MRVRRLGWAGIEIEFDGSYAVVDLFREATDLVAYVGEPREALLESSAPGATTVALVTHLHSDHADIDAIERALAPDGVLLRPPRAEGTALEVAGMARAEARLARSEIRTLVPELWQTVTAGPFALTPVPAVDGLGDPQVGWSIAGGGCRIVHYGDTLFHGSWWLTRMRCGPFGLAFVPINGPIVDLPHRQPPSPLPAVMDPEQAAAAGHLLGAPVAVPVHYDTLHRAPTYIQADEPGPSFRRAAERYGIDVLLLEPGEWVDVVAPAAQSAGGRRSHTAEQQA
jgi:L-ascorbate metabolism protein UlaG (beta-lactamase superfamily)